MIKIAIGQSEISPAIRSHILHQASVANTREVARKYSPAPTKVFIGNSWISPESASHVALSERASKARKLALPPTMVLMGNGGISTLARHVAASERANEAKARKSTVLIGMGTITPGVAAHVRRMS